MNAPFKTSADPLDAPLWDLSDLYASREDARIQADLERTRALVNELNGLQGRLAAAQDEPETLGRRLDQAITLYEDRPSAPPRPTATMRARRASRPRCAKS
jgi:oligoendopeptidase F